MNELYRAIIADLCKAVTALLSQPSLTNCNTGNGEAAKAEQDTITAAKKAVASAKTACEVANYYHDIK